MANERNTRDGSLHYQPSFVDCNGFTTRCGFAGHGTPVRDFEEQEGRIRSAETREFPQDRSLSAGDLML
jgi:hypothetical protein